MRCSGWTAHRFASMRSGRKHGWPCCAAVSVRPDGGWKRYLWKLLFLTLLCFTVMSTHVVCFVVLPFLVAGWVLICWLEALNRRTGQAGRTLLRAVGLALGGAAGRIAAAHLQPPKSES